MITSYQHRRKVLISRNFTHLHKIMKNKINIEIKTPNKSWFEFSEHMKWAQSGCCAALHLCSNPYGKQHRPHTTRQTRATHQEKKCGCRSFPNGLVVAGADADDVAPRSTWGTVSSAHINKATLASLASRSSRRCRCAQLRGLPAWHCWVPALMVWSF